MPQIYLKTYRWNSTRLKWVLHLTAWVRLQLMCNVEFKTSVISKPPHDMGYLGPISWACSRSSVQNTLSRYKSTLLRWFLHLNEVSFDVKCGVKLFGWLSMYWCPWLGVFGSDLPDLPQFPKYTETSLTQPSDCLHPWVRLHLIWNDEFNTINDLSVYQWQWCGVFGPNLLDLSQIPNTKTGS